MNDPNIAKPTSSVAMLVMSTGGYASAPMSACRSPATTITSASKPLRRNPFRSATAHA